MATRKYDKTRLDLHYKKSNETLEFYISDTDTSDFYIRLTRANMPIKVDDLIIVLCVIDPSNQVRTQFISADTNKEGFVYCKLENSMKSQVGTYQAKVMLVYEDEKIVTDTFTYIVKNDMFVALSQEIIADERFETLNDMLSEISRIKNQEEDRVVAENGRVATMTRIENEIAQLVLDVNSKVNTNVSENTTKTDELILSVNTKVDNSLNMNTSSVNELITNGDNILSGIELNSNQLITSIDEYKNSAVEDIEVYKTTKDSEINQTLTDYKTSTTESVNSFIEGETLKLRNDLTVDRNAYKESLNTEFNKLDSDLKLNINNFVADKSTYIDTYLQGKSLELTRYINDKNVELNTYINSKTTELNNYISTKNTELNTYKTTKNAEIDKYFNDKNTEFNNNEKTRTSNESRRETNEYARGMNENNRKAAEDKRVSSFTQMTNEFNSMVQYNNEEIQNKYDDIVSDGTTITMMANGVIKKSITLSNSGSGGEGHTHANKSTLDKITEEKLTSWDNKVNSVVGKGLSTNDYTTVEKTKLQGIEQNANYYTHPTIHLPSMIAQDSNNRFVTDIEKLIWNNKSNFSGSYDDLSNKPIIPTVTNDLTSALKTNYDTAYTHSQSSHAPSTAQKNSDITKGEIEAKLTGVISSHSHEGTSSSGGGTSKKLLARYVHSSNKVIQPTSLNLTTGIFTCINHGLTESSKLMMNFDVFNFTTIRVIPKELFLKFMCNQWVYLKPIIVSGNEFKLDGITYDASVNTSVNVSKFWFETVDTESITINNLQEFTGLKNIQIITNGLNTNDYGLLLSCLNNTVKDTYNYWYANNENKIELIPFEVEHLFSPKGNLNLSCNTNTIIQNGFSTTTVNKSMMTVTDTSYKDEWNITNSHYSFIQLISGDSLDYKSSFTVDVYDRQNIRNGFTIEIYDLGVI